MSALRSAVAAAAACVAFAAAADEHGPRPSSRQQLLDGAASALARGDAASALRDYEAAAAQEHALDIELGIVRSLMRGGEYRRALAFAAHSAGAHGDDVRGALLYARLLDLGAQARAAQRVLDAAVARVTDAAAFDAARRSAAADEAASFAPLPAGSPLMSSATLVDGGRRALLPAAPLDRATTTLALRDGLGRIVRARVIDRDDALGVALLELASPLDGAPRLQRAARAPFPGAPVYTATVSCAAPSDGCAPWPRLLLGFLGNAGRLDIERVAPAPGGPVFDAAGRWIGIALQGEGSAARLLDSAVLSQRFGLQDSEPGGSEVGTDLLYEKAMRMSLQVLADPSLGLSLSKP